MIDSDDTVRAYLREADLLLKTSYRADLKTEEGRERAAAREYVLTTRVRAMVDAMGTTKERVLSERIKAILSDRTHPRYAMVRVGQDALNELIQANLLLVVSVVKTMATPTMPLLDLIQEGNDGLRRGIERFDPERRRDDGKPIALSTYVTHWIDQAASRYAQAQRRSVRLPSHVTDLLSRIRRSQNDLAGEQGEDPTTAQVAAHLGVDEGDIIAVLRASQPIASLDRTVSTDGDTRFGDLIEDQQGPSPDEQANDAEKARVVNSVLHSLPPRIARVLQLRMGWGDGRVMTLEEVAAERGQVRELVRQDEEEGMALLKGPDRLSKLAPYQD